MEDLNDGSGAGLDPSTRSTRIAELEQALRGGQRRNSHLLTYYAALLFDDGRFMEAVGAASLAYMYSGQDVGSAACSLSDELEEVYDVSGVDGGWSRMAMVDHLDGSSTVTIAHRLMGWDVA